MFIQLKTNLPQITMTTRNMQIETENLLEDTAVLGTRRADIRQSLKTFSQFKRVDSCEAAPRPKGIYTSSIKILESHEKEVNFKKFLTSPKCSCGLDIRLWISSAIKANCRHCGQFFGIHKVRKLF